MPQMQEKAHEGAKKGRVWRLKWAVCAEMTRPQTASAPRHRDVGRGFAKWADTWTWGTATESVGENVCTSTFGMILFQVNTHQTIPMRTLIETQWVTHDSMEKEVKKWSHCRLRWLTLGRTQLSDWCAGARATTWWCLAGWGQAPGVRAWAPGPGLHTQEIRAHELCLGHVRAPDLSLSDHAFLRMWLSMQAFRFSVTGSTFLFEQLSLLLSLLPLQNATPYPNSSCSFILKHSALCHRLAGYGHSLLCPS